MRTELSPKDRETSMVNRTRERASQDGLTAMVVSGSEFLGMTAEGMRFK